MLLRVIGESRRMEKMWLLKNGLSESKTSTSESDVDFFV
jgi:hypothetical protein